MLIRPELVPEDLDRGYLGRVMRWNGFRTEQETLDQMLRWSGLQGKSQRDVSMLELLSKVAGVELQQFVRMHTSLPLRRAITSYLPNLKHGSDEQRSMLWTSGMRLARPGAYSCRECRKEDHDFHGFVYWRRDHQIPGQWWCPKHAIPLDYIEDESAFLYSPAKLEGHYQTVPESWVRQAQGNQAIQRFLDISAGLIDRDSPLHVKHVSAELKNKATEQGYQTSWGTVKLPLLSDAVVEIFGVRWLSTVLPALLDKEKGAPLSKLDGVLYLNTSASTVNAYILAAAVLYESADEALNSLISAKKVLTGTRVRNASLIDEATLLDTYISGRGSHPEVASLLSVNRAAIAVRLRSAGLPNLTENEEGQGSLAALDAYYKEGKTLAESALIGGISFRSLENLIRTIGAPFTQALRDMQRPTGRGTGIRRQRQLTPLEAKLATESLEKTATLCRHVETAS